jgi:MFS family permease
MVTAPDTMADEVVRTRLVWTMFAANALSSTAFIAITTVAPLVAEALVGGTALAGLPLTAATIGTAGGALVLSDLGSRWGRRPTFGLGFALGATGAAAAVAAALAGSFVGFVLGLAVLGFGRSVSQLARYAAGDLRTEAHRGRAISLVVWASTIGAVVGPLLVGPAGRRGEAVGLGPELGPVVLGAALFAIAAVLLVVALRPDPIELAVREPTEAITPSGGGLGRLLRLPTVWLSMTVLVTSQLVMVLVMAMTPLHIRGAGGDLDAVGLVMAAHTLGMFALAPVTGWLVDRFGSGRVMAAGGVTLVASCLLATPAAGDDTAVLLVSLFGLGYGWNLGFVAASSHLQHGLGVADRTRIQGVADAVTWLAGALGAGVSGAVVAAGSYTTLASTGAALACAIPLALVVRRVRTA